MVGAPIALATRQALTRPTIPRYRRFSSELQPLFLWLGRDAAKKQTPPPVLLLPQTPPEEPNVTSPNDMLTLVNQHYGQDERFITDMGDNDAGVSLVSCNDKDILDEFPDLIREGLELVRQERHGIPFTLYTSGILLNDDINEYMSTLQLFSAVQVSLHGSNPTNYPGDSQDFGQVCSFIGMAVEAGIPVEVGLLKQHASAGRELATSLGARQIHVY